MELFGNIKSNIANLDLWQLLVPVLQKRNKEIVAVVQDQMSKGIRGDGAKIGDYRSDAYVALKEREVPTYKLNGEVDLRFSGDFYQDMYAEVNQNEVRVGSKDSKEEKLQGQYSELIFDITEQNIDLVTDDKAIEEFANIVLTNILKN